MSNKKLQIGIVWANPYNKNMGVAALAYSCLAIFNDICKENSINAELTLVGSNGPSIDSITIGGDKIEFSNVPGYDFLNWKILVKLVLFPRQFRTRKLLSLDVVFDIAEGDSFSDIYGVQRFQKILNSKRLFNLLNVKQVLLPQTIGPFKSPDVQRRAFAVMKKLEKVISRDRKSFDYTRQHLPAKSISEAIDVAFYMPFEKVSPTPGFTHVGLNISGLLWNGGYTKNNQFDMKTDYQKLIHRIILFFTEDQNVKLHLVSHVIPTDNDVEDDIFIAAELNRKYPKTVLAPRFNSPIEAKSYISGMNFFMGARMHACIAAFSTGVPVVPMAYSRKFNGLFGDTLEYKWFGDCVNNSDEEVFNLIRKSYAERDLLENQIKTANENIVVPRLNSLKSQLLMTLKSL